TDFSNHKGNAVTAVTFFDQSFNTAYGFFTKYTQWQWLLTYLGTIATEHTGDLVVSDGGMARARIEIAGYLASGVAKNSDETFVSFDYSAYANDLGFGEYLKQASFEYVEEVTAGDLNSKDTGSVFDNTSMGSDADSDLYMQALAIVRNDKKASTSYIQRKLRIGYNRAAALIDRMEEEGIVGPADHVGRREILN
ncbi:MAG: hypothetical protein IJW75_05530, partial [Alphaproteobacteria bacterium]|nr:hypothetical protein [Alphaproteobacteria bacterium]